jgi:hypothetical protein
MNAHQPSLAQSTQSDPESHVAFAIARRLRAYEVAHGGAGWITELANELEHGLRNPDPAPGRTAEDNIAEELSRISGCLWDSISTHGYYGGEFEDLARLVDSTADRVRKTPLDDSDIRHFARLVKQATENGPLRLVAKGSTNRSGKSCDCIEIKGTDDRIADEIEQGSPFTDLMVFVGNKAERLLGAAEEAPWVDVLLAKLNQAAAALATISNQSTEPEIKAMALEWFHETRDAVIAASPNAIATPDEDDTVGASHQPVQPEINCVRADMINGEPQVYIQSLVLVDRVPDMATDLMEDGLYNEALGLEVRGREAKQRGHTAFWACVMSGDPHGLSDNRRDAYLRAKASPSHVAYTFDSADPCAPQVLALAAISEDVARMHATEKQRGDEIAALLEAVRVLAVAPSPDADESPSP